MAKVKLINNYRIIIDQIFDPAADIKDVHTIKMDIYAKTIEDAISKAWESLNLDNPQDYEITLIESMNRPHYEDRCNRF